MRLLAASDPTEVVWTDWFGTEPWLLAGVVVTICALNAWGRRKARLRPLPRSSERARRAERHPDPDHEARSSEEE